MIDKSDNKNELCLKEIFWIKFYDARNPNVGYNIGLGGEGTGSGEDHPFYRLFGEKHHRYGKRYCHSEETIRKMSLDRRGENNNNYGKITPEETKQKIRKSLVGKKLSDEHKRKIRESASGENYGMRGKHHSEETKQKMRKPKSEESKRKMKEAWVKRKEKKGLVE